MPPSSIAPYKDPFAAANQTANPGYQYRGVQDIAKMVFNPLGIKRPAQATSSTQTDNLSAQIKALEQQIAGMRNVYAPQLDFATINAQARKSAEKAINPLYQRKLKEFVEEQKVKKARKQSEYQTAVQDLEDSLAQALGASELSRTRTSEDVATNVAQINQAEDIFQTDAGDQFNVDRAALAEQVFGSGMTTAGKGKQQVATQQAGRNTEEQRQTEQFQFNRTAQQLFKSRTFEDLLKSDELNTLATGKGKEQAKFNLDNYLQDVGFETRAKKQLLETQRLQDVLSEASRQRSSLVAKFIQGIADPAQRQAAYSAYGGFA